MRRALFPATLAIALAVTLLPLWVARHLPAVDAPQHLFLVHVLRALRDPASPYHETFEAGWRFTYATFYQGTAWLSAGFGEETALRLWLTLVMGAIPLALLALLRALGRSPWLALLACPLVYTDGFYWGLFGFHSTLALVLASLAWCVRALERPAQERGWAVLLALALLGVALTHVAALPLPVLGIAYVTWATASDTRRRRRVCLATVPALALVSAWLLAGVQRGRDVDLGKRWSGTGSLLDAENYTFEPLAKRAIDLTGLLGNGFWGLRDFWPIVGWLGVVVVAVGLGIRQARRGERSREAFDPRPLGLLLLALACYFLLPTDIAGYMYMIHGRYAQLAALCALPALPRLRRRALAAVATLAGALVCGSGLQHALLFARFEREARPFDELAAHLPEGARILHLVVDPSSRVATHAVYLHYAALAALRAEGIPSFSLAQDPSFPVNYRPGRRPPAPKWEWRPARFSWEEHARHYDHFLVRGADPSQLFGAHLVELEPVARAGPWMLLRRR